MERTVTASAVVDLPILRARELLLGDLAGLVRGDAGVPVALELGAPETDGCHLLVPVSCRGTADDVPLRHLHAHLALRDHHLGSLVHLHGCYQAALGESFGDGLRAHRYARWFAEQLVHGVGDRLLERAVPA